MYIFLIAKNKICHKCDKYPSFNFSHRMRAIYCVKHKNLILINIKNKKCLKYMSFNFVGKITGLYCLKNKKTNMINLKNSTIYYKNELDNYIENGHNIQTNNW